MYCDAACLAWTQVNFRGLIFCGEIRGRRIGRHRVAIALDPKRHVLSAGGAFVAAAW